ncbi:MAG TPA: hypothetical protein VN776_01435 [Terracidiphilus sp.]|nr:hypothetical protein [Terracidiphilus sp.]
MANQEFMISISHEANWVILRWAQQQAPLLRIGRRLLQSIPIHITYLRLPLDGQEQDIPIFSTPKPGSGWRAGLGVALIDAEVSPSEYLLAVLRFARREGYVKAREFKASRMEVSMMEGSSDRRS